MPFHVTRQTPGVFGRKLFAALSLAVVFASSTTVVFGRAIASPADVNLQNPIYQPLPTGAGPETNDMQDGEKPATVTQEDLAKSSAELTNGELSDLWDAALANSSDIHFIIEKLAPKRDSIKSGGAVKDLSHALYSCVMAGEGMVPSGNQSAGTALIMDVLSGDHKSKSDKQAAVKESDAIMLYKMVRDTARKVTTNFYNYKKYMNALDRANLDMMDLSAMVSNSKDKVDALHAPELDYLLRKQQRDIDAIKASMSRSRKEIEVLCGSDAVNKLDEQLAENISLNRRTAVKVPRPVFTEPDTPTHN
ncbi:MAG TPA: hypothetical protein V6C97_29660 [Oculatellaceae cyanobacterium]